ncbi:MAG: glycosyltransferase family 4 protein [Pseudothermotoga sp.]
MKVLLYAEATRLISKSGIGIAYKHQIEALSRVGVDFTREWEDVYDIAHVNTVGPGAKNVVRHCKNKGIPVIWHVHTTPEDIKNSFIFSNIYARLSRRSLTRKYAQADHLIFPTQYTENVVRKYGVKVPGTVISNGVDTQIFRKNLRRAREFRERFSLSGPIVLGVGFPFRRKGIQDFAEIASRMKDVTFIWFGARIWPLLPKDIRRILKNPPHNMILPGFVSQEELIGAYSAADVFFFPSYEENEGIVVLEALSCECPVVVRDIPVYKGWLENGVNCLKGHSNDEFEQIIRTILRDRDLSEKIATNGRTVALERDLSVIGDSLLKTYEAVLRRCRS